MLKVLTETQSATWFTSPTQTEHSWQAWSNRWCKEKSMHPMGQALCRPLFLRVILEIFKFEENYIKTTITVIIFDAIVEIPPPHDLKTAVNPLFDRYLYHYVWVKLNELWFVVSLSFISLVTWKEICGEFVLSVTPQHFKCKPYILLKKPTSIRPCYYVQMLGAQK